MNMVTFDTTPEVQIENDKVKLDIASLIGKETILEPSKYAPIEDKPKKKKIKINDTEVVTAKDDLPMTQTNTPYKDSYEETNDILKTAIIQLDIATNDLSGDIKDVRSSKTLRNKYNYLTDMYGTFGNLIGNKIRAASELNNSIKNAHDLELKRAKEFKLYDQVDDNKAIMDTYNAFVSMPVSSNPVNGYQSPLGPSTSDLTLLSNNMMASAVGANPDIGYQNYLNNLSPEQAMMFYENNPDVKQVVVYNQDTYERHFEIMNTRTGEILHGLPKRNDAMYMPDTVLDIPNKIARNVNLDETYEIVLVGTGKMSEY